MRKVKIMSDGMRYLLRKKRVLENFNFSVEKGGVDDFDISGDEFVSYRKSLKTVRKEAWGEYASRYDE